MVGCIPCSINKLLTLSTRAQRRDYRSNSRIPEAFPRTRIPVVYLCPHCGLYRHCVLLCAKVSSFALEVLQRVDRWVDMARRVCFGTSRFAAWLAVSQLVLRRALALLSSKLPWATTSSNIGSCIFCSHLLWSPFVSRHFYSTRNCAHSPCSGRGILSQRCSRAF